MRTGTTAIFTRLLAALMALLLLATCVGAALAENTDDIVYDGITYYNVNQKNIANPSAFYPALLNAELGNGYSMAERWLQVMIGYYFGRYKGGTNFNDEDAAINALYEALKRYTSSQGNYNARFVEPVYAKSMNKAYTILLERAKSSNYFYDLENVSNGDCKSFSDFNETQDVVATYVVVGGPWQSSDPSQWGQGTQMFVAYFTDLELVALLPDATIDGSYVTQKVGDASPVEMIEASEIKNAARSPINAEVTLSSAWSSTVDGAIQNSEGYNLPEVIQRDEPFHFDAEQRFPETYTAADAFENGWKGEAARVLSKDEGYTVTMPLPPCTNVLLKRMNYNNTATTTFDCPVGLKFKVRLATGGDILFNNQRQGLVFGKLAFNSDVLAELKEQTGDKYNDVIGYGETGEAVNAIVGRAPMTILPASFTETVKGESTEYVDTVPTLPLDSVKLVPPSNTTFIMDGEFSYGKLNYMHADMALGESAFTDLLTVKGYNKEGAEYYGFNPSRGGWMVTDKDGNNITGNKSAPIELDDATGKYTAVKPGTCYLRYAIDEKTYPDFDPSEDDLAKVFYGEEALEKTIANRNLSSWAALEITVKGDLYTMNISGSYNGYVNREPETLNKKDGGLVVSVIDNRSDLQTNEVPYTWQTQELEGIKLEEDGTVSFTEPGEYHVRAINKAEGLVSDWVVIHAYDKAPVTIATAPVAAAITYGQDLSASVLSGGKAFEADTEDAVEGTFTWKNPSVKPNVADSDVTAYEVVFTPVDAEMYEQGSCMVTLTVNPAPAQAVTAPRPRPLVYNGQSQALVNAGKADGGILWYALADDGDIAPVFDDNNAGGVWSVNPPAGVDAGEYYVWYIVDADANHTDSEAKCVKAIINNEPTDPEAPLRGTLVYNGAAQALVKPGSVVGGTLQYYVGETVPENEADWSREAPSAVDAGAYCVWYRVKGDKNHNDTVPTALEVAISPKPLYVKALNASKISGEADPELTYEVTGLVGMDRLRGKLAREAGEAVGGYAIGLGSLTAGDNYAIDFEGATFTVVSVKPDFTLLAKATPSGKKIIKLTWTKVEGAQGYDVYFKKCDGDENYPLYKSVKGTSCKIRKLKSGTCYKGYVHAWRKEGGKKVYIGDGSPVVHCITGKYNRTRTNVKSVKLNKTSINLAKGESGALVATVKKVMAKRKVLNHEKTVRFLSSNANVAKVDQNGVVTGVHAGVCTIYAISPNGVRASAQVTVTE